ncbi:MAG: choice-of-anchor D domain-containing protein [Myxococcales bacterium]|nr:choice-of-anchor D domain-containing protein [Myxococcales bacterium]
MGIRIGSAALLLGLAGCGGGGRPALAFDRARADLGSVVVGRDGALQTFRLSNPGKARTGTLITAVSGERADFALVDGCATRSLAVGEDCSIGVTFRPGAAGVRAAILTVSSGGTSATLQLTGTGLAPAAIAFDAAAHEFGVVDVGQTTTAFAFHLANSGEVATASLTTTAAEGFVLTDGCAGLAVAAGASCTIAVAAAPLSHGTKSAQIRVAGGSLSAAFAVSAIGRDQVPLTVTLSGDGAGTVSAPGLSCNAGVCSGTYPRTDSFATVTLTATVGVRSAFAGWNGACPASDVTCAVPMDGPRSIIAIFLLTPAVLAVDVDHGSFGTVDVPGPSTSKTFTFQNSGGQSTGTLSTIVSGDADFTLADGCAGAALAGGAGCAISATFTPRTYGTKSATATVTDGTLSAAIALGGIGRDTVSLSVTLSGTGTGAVSGAGLSCSGKACTGTYPRADTLQTTQLTETPDVSSTFSAWGGDCADSGATCTLLMDSNRSATAQFTIRTFVLGLHERLQGGGGGGIASDQDGVGCASSCDSTVVLDYGTQVTLAATPAAGSLFRWSSGDCFGPEATCELTMLADRSTTGIFNGTNYVFVTSTAHDGNLGGLVGADAICKARADAAGLPGTYVAWLSTSTVTAVSRLGAARGWMRLDGLPFADVTREPFSGKPAGLTAGQIYYPVRIDETGADVHVAVATGATAHGDAYLTCQDWTSASEADYVNLGISIAGPVGWTESGGTLCDAQLNLYCFGTDLVTTVTPATATGRTAFVSKALWTPGAGIASADAVCATEATAAKLPGEFKALIATSTASAASRFDMSAGSMAWVRTDGLPVVAASADLLTGQLLTPIAVFADGTYPDPFVEVWQGAAWAGATSAGAAPALDGTCNDWTDGSATTQGWFGLASEAGPDYFVANADSPGLRAPCSYAYSLYCLEQ